jgi:CHAD domain-containing protein
VTAADAGLKTLATRLGPTRDWDVLVTETLAEVASAFPTEDRLTRLLTAAERRRLACHDELRSFLTSAEFRRLGIDLACLAHAHHPPSSAAADESSPPLDEFATTVLNQRLKKLLRADGHLAGLAPQALHAVRLRAKRLRYAAEIFVTLYEGKPPQRFLKQLSRLQDRLGSLNDGAVAASLLDELSGRHLAFPTGLVLGFIGAHGNDARGRIETAWRKFRKVTPFWQ